jgi:hypothetical protein
MPKSCTKSASVAAMLLTAGLGAGLLGASSAHAAFIGCRSDPIVILSNGVVIDLSANIADDVHDVQSITYVLHVPKGVSLLRSISTDGPVGYQEQFNFQPDSKLSGPAGVYQVELQVQTRSKHIGVTATIAGGDAGTLGITPGMVSPGATTFTPVDANDAGKHGGKGPSAPPSLPATVTSALNTWAQSAAWAMSTSATATTDQHLNAVISL